MCRDDIPVRSRFAKSCKKRNQTKAILGIWRSLAKSDNQVTSIGLPLFWKKIRILIHIVYFGCWQTSPASKGKLALATACTDVPL